MSYNYGPSSNPLNQKLSVKGAGSTAGGNQMENKASASGGGVENSDFSPNVISFFENIEKNNIKDAKTVLQRLTQEEINKMLEIAKINIANIDTSDEDIAKLKEFLPMIINKQLQLQQQQTISGQDMDKYISDNFPTALEAASNTVSKMSSLYDNSNSKSASGGKAFDKTLSGLVSRNPEQMTGGAKGKGKTAKNRKQRFNIRLV
jgi:hypothetical protein